MKAKWVMGGLLTLGLVGVLTYLRVAFWQADIKTAVKLVEEVKVGGHPLKEKINRVIPLERRYCSVKETNTFYGHTEVTCVDTQRTEVVLVWKVNVIDGMVVPGNEAAKALGQTK